MSDLMYTSRCLNNGLIIIDALAPDEKQTGRRLFSDITDHSYVIGREGYCSRYEVASADAFHACLAAVLNECKAGVLKPVLHFECHGHPEKGMQIGSSKEYVSWDNLQRIVGLINQATRHNCGVVMAACYGYAISIGLDVCKPSPFNFLVAPNEEMQAGVFEDTMSSFYKTVASTGDLRNGLTLLPSDMQLLIAGEWFYRTLGTYLAKHHTHKNRQQITEEVVTKQLATPSDFNRAQRRGQLKHIRQTAKSRVNDTRGFVHHFASTFFHGEPPVETKEVLAWVKGKKESR